MKIQTHLQNLYLLIEEAGSLGELARRSGYDNPSALYQLKHRLEKQAQDETAKGRGIQSALQAKLENGMASPPAGWAESICLKKKRPKKRKKPLPRPRFGLWLRKQRKRAAPP